MKTIDMKNTSKQVSETSKNANIVARARKENVERLQALKDKYEKTGSDADLKALNDYVTRYDWFTRIIEGPDGKKGMEDPAGKVLIPAVFDEVAYTYDTNFIQPSAVPCVKSGKCALVKTDGTGENITPFDYDIIKDIPGCYLYTKNGSKSFGIMTRDGKELMPCILTSYSEPSNGVMFFTSGSLHGLWHQEFGILLQPIYDNIEFIDLGEPLLFTKNGVVGYVDFDQNFVPKAEVDAIEDEDEKHDRLLEFLYMDCEY